MAAFRWTKVHVPERPAPDIHSCLGKPDETILVEADGDSTKSRARDLPNAPSGSDADLSGI